MSGMRSEDRFVAGLRAYFAANPDVKPATVSAQAGLNKSAIRKILAGLVASPRRENAERIAQVLGMTEEQIIALGAGQPVEARQIAAPQGMAEDAAPFASAQGQSPDARAALNLLWPGHPQVTHRATNSLPDLGIALGDFIVCDMAGLVSPGDIALCTVTDEQTASATTIIRRVAPPWLICGHDLLAIDAPGVQVRWPVVGVIHSPRG